MTAWKALVGRITLFPVSTPPGAVELFRQVWGGDPDSFQKQANPLLPTVAQGKHHGMTAICSTHPARVDLTLTPARSDEATEMSVVMIEDLGQLQTDLLRIIEAVGRGVVSESVSRVAVNTQFVRPEASSADANKTIMQTIPEQYRMRLTDEEEFIFRINRLKMSSELPHIKMNFLTTWSVERFQVLALSIVLPGTPIAAPQSILSQQQTSATLAASVLFDNNNVPATTPLTSKQQSTLLLEGLHAIAKAQNEMGLNGEDALR
jgi:hypothetical protein